MSESRQWLESPWRSSEVLFVRLLHYSKCKGQTGTLSLIWTLSLFGNYWQNRVPEVLSEVCLESPCFLEIISSDLEHFYVLFHPLPIFPFQFWLSWPQPWTWRGYFSSTAKMPKSCQKWLCANKWIWRPAWGFWMYTYLRVCPWEHQAYSRKVW